MLDLLEWAEAHMPDFLEEEDDALEEWEEEDDE